MTLAAFAPVPFSFATIQSSQASALSIVQRNKARTECAISDKL
jgi:hypothetical protein